MRRRPDARRLSSRFALVTAGSYSTAARKGGHLCPPDRAQGHPDRSLRGSNRPAGRVPAWALGRVAPIRNIERCAKVGAP